MNAITIVIIGFLIMETANVATLYFFPGSKYANGVGVFKAWERPGFFQEVHLGSQKEISWNDEIDLCPDSLYLRLTKKTPEDVFPNLKSGVNA